MDEAPFRSFRCRGRSTARVRRPAATGPPPWSRAPGAWRRSASIACSARRAWSCARFRSTSDARRDRRRRLSRRRRQSAAGPRSRRAGGGRLSRRGRRAELAPPRRPVLVVDDSLTTRMLEQSILESAGYEVDVAMSARGGARERAPQALCAVSRRCRNAGHGRLRLRRARSRRPGDPRHPGDPGDLAQRARRIASAGATSARKATSSRASSIRSSS